MMGRQFFWLWALLVLSSTLAITESANILFLLPLATKSHKNVFDPIVVALSQRGHNVTVVAPLKFKNPVPNVREMSPIPLDEINPGLTNGNPFQKRKEGRLSFFMNYNSTYLENACHKLYQDKEIQNLLEEGKGTFDVVLVNAFMNQCALGIVHILEAPHIYVVTMPGINMIVQKTGLHFPPSFVPCSLGPYSDHMSFKERVINFLTEYGMILVAQWYYGGYYEKMYRDHLGSDIPSVPEIDKNLSLILMNSHFTLTYPRPLLPDVVEVGGMHTRPAKPLPKDLEEFASGGSHGFILFSLGSIVQAKDMPDEMRRRFLNVFAKLKQRVLWKWEGDIPEVVPPNVKVSKWLPQQDILGHPNIKLFMTHGGLLSTQEAVYHGVPLIGFPVLADQDLNMVKAEKAGIAITLEINEFTEEILENTINRLLTESSFTERAKQLSAVYRDQPLKPIETAVYWVEYIINHKGARHLRSGGRDLSFMAYHSIDVTLFIAGILLVVLWVIKNFFEIIFRLIFKRQSEQSRMLSKKTK